MANSDTTYSQAHDKFMQMYEQRYVDLVDFVTGMVDRHDVAEDLVQELFARLWEKGVNMSQLTEGYLFTSVKNAAIDYLRRAEMENRYAEQVERTETETAEWEEQLDEQVLTLLFKEIDKLPERCREIFLLHLDGCSNDEIAARMNLSVLTVKTQKKRAMKKLREYFDNEAEQHGFLPLLAIAGFALLCGVSLL